MNALRIDARSRARAATRAASRAVLLAVVLVLTLAGCRVSGGGSYEPLPQARISDLRLYSSHVSSSGQPYICDDATTTLWYTFRHDGDLAWWQSVLVGRQFGEGLRSPRFTPRHQAVDYTGTRATSYLTIERYTAPLGITDEAAGTTGVAVDAQAIVVVPVPVKDPKIISYATFGLTVTPNHGWSRSYTFSPRIPIVTGCN